jgi:serine/threonine protein kinase/Tfp pilus assembly protein PilF
MMTITIGNRLGRYEICAKIGEGGMGEVYLAQDTKLDRKVALKILPADVAAYPDRMKRFVREAKAASALNHPNIITIHEIDETDSGHFIATEFIDGETLRERELKTPLKLGESLDIAAQIASALSAAHAAGIVHRDIKPENVMLRRDGIVKVLDFGLAKLAAPSIDSVDREASTRANVNTDPGMVMGTAIYMSPEQARGLPVDTRTDIFSLGVVLYEMVAGRLPFDGSNRNEIMASVLSDREPQPLTRYSSEAPAELGRIVLKALRKDRDERYQTIKDMLLDLQSLKQELEFERKLERSESRRFEGVLPSNQNTEVVSAAATGADAAGVAATSPRTAHASSAEYIVSGIKQHKSIAVIIAGLLLVGIAGAGYRFFIRRASTPVTKIDSIAVLPFENATHDQNNEYFADGVTDSLINSLSRIPNVKVTARNSVFSYKNQTPNLQQVAKQLNVQALLSGRVLMQGDTLDVRVELTDTQNNIQLWGDHYVRKTADIFAVQDEIARQVTEALRVRLTGGQQEQITKRYTQNAEAYRFYLQGRYFLNQVSEENLKRAIPFFDQAIGLDPHYALAYAARGESFFLMGDISLPMSEAKRKVEQDIAAALSIDDKLVEARMLRANIEFQYDWNFAKAEEDFKQVIALNPNFAEAHHQYGAFNLPMTGRVMEGVAEMELAQQLDPVNPNIVVDMNLPYYFARQYDQAIAQNRKALEMFPNYFLPHMALGQALFQKGDYSAGIEEIEKAKAMEPTPPSIGILGYAYARSGRKDEARKLLAELKEQLKRRYVASYWIAVIYMGLEEKDEAFSWLEKAYQERSWWLLWIKMDPMMDSLRSDPRFTDLTRRIGFPQ